MQKTQTQLQYKHICFTSFNIDLEWFKDWTKEKKGFITYIILQGELTKEGKKHIQGYAQFNGQKRMDTIKNYFKDNALHIEQPRGTPEQNKKYCSKDEKEGEKQLKFKEFEEYGEINLELGKKGNRTDLIELKNKIINGERIIDILTMSEDNIEIHNILTYNKTLKDLENHVRRNNNIQIIAKEYENIIWKDWQQKIINMVEDNTDNRKIKWLYDELGNNGKSFLARYLLTHKKVYYITGGKQNDILYGYDNQPIIIYDLARTYADTLDHIYTTIENFKNGQYLSTKYETEQRIFKIPHIIVMANFKPDITKLSNDRWDIEEIRNIEENNNNKDIIINEELINIPETTEEIIKDIRETLKENIRIQKIKVDKEKQQKALKEHNEYIINVENNNILRPLNNINKTFAEVQKTVKDNNNISTSGA